MTQERFSPPTWKEKDRLEALNSYGILDTPVEEDFEDIVKMASGICNAPISLISLVSAGRQWFKAAVGVGLSETPLNMSICAHAIQQGELFVIPDTTKDERTSENPLVSGDPHVRFYAGAQLLSPEGFPLGTVCVLDYKPRTLSTREADALKSLARQVMTLLELRRALNAKNRSEDKLNLALEALSRVAAVVESSDDAIITKSLDGTILSWNAAAERIFGYSPGEIIGKSILTLIPTEIQHEEPRIIEQLSKGQRIEHYETVRLGKGGRRIDISLTVSPVKDRSGKVIAASKIARDITEERKRQKEIRESETRFRDELEQQVNERTASLKEAVAQMEEFSYSVSHDLRAPLRAMQGYATALLEDYSEKIDNEGQEYLKLIISACDRMDRLTHDVLVYSRIPRTSFTTQAVDLDKLVADIVRQNVPDQKKDVSISIERPLLSVVGNDSFLSQAVSNLIDNAVKFASRERPLKIRIWTERREDQVRFWVEDNGIGILPEHQGRVWGMFERVHPGIFTKAQASGSPSFARQSSE